VLHPKSALVDQEDAHYNQHDSENGMDALRSLNPMTIAKIVVLPYELLLQL